MFYEGADCEDLAIDGQFTYTVHAGMPVEGPTTEVVVTHMPNMWVADGGFFAPDDMLLGTQMFTHIAPPEGMELYRCQER